MASLEKVATRGPEESCSLAFPGLLKGDTLKPALPVLACVTY